MDSRQIVITRVYAATPQQVWEAWTTATLLERFFGPRWAPVRRGSAAVDLRVGGELTLEMQGAESGDIFPMAATYELVEPPARFVIRTSRGGTMDVSIEDVGEGKSLLTWIIEGEMDDEFYRGTTRGTHDGADQLAELLAEHRW